MKSTKTISDLVQDLNQQTLLVEEAEIKIRQLRAQLLEIMEENKADKIETPYGKATVVESRSLDFSDFEEVNAAKELLSKLKEKLSDQAPVTISKALRFFANRGYAAPEVKKSPEKKTVKMYKAGRTTRRRSSALLGS